MTAAGLDPGSWNLLTLEAARAAAADGVAVAVADVLAGQGIGARLHRIGIPDEYAPVGPPTHLYRHYGLDAPGILARIREVTADRG